MAESQLEFKIPKIEIPKPENFQPEIETKEFISPDEKLKFQYSSDWTEMPKEAWQETINTEGKILFFASKFKIEKLVFSSLVAQELNWEGNIEEFIEKMKKETKEKGGEMKILNQEIKNQEAVLKVRYQKGEKTNFISKEKIILGEGKIYLISIFSPERFWPEFDQEADEILNSVQLLDKNP